VIAGPSSARIKLEIFPGGGNLPIWVAQEKGLLAKYGIELEIVQTPGSVQQLSNLIQGRSHVALTLVDNVVAYREGQGEVPIMGDDLVIAMTVDTAVLPTLITLPGIRTYADLRGKVLSVDALTTGYAFVLLAMLERGGLERGAYRIASVGGAIQRFETLKRHEYAGALFNSPFEAMLVSAGFCELQTAASVFSHYQGMSLAVRLGWAESNRRAVVGLCRAILDAIEWIYDPNNRAEAVQILGRSVKDTPAGLAAAHARLTDPKTGLRRGGVVDIEGIREVLRLRSRYASPKKDLVDPVKYYDATFLGEARDGLRGH